VSETHLNGNGSHPDPKHASPATGASEEARNAVARARHAQQRWRLEPLSTRVAALTRAAKGMLARRAEVIALAHDEMGKVEAEGLFNEALGPLDTVKGWARVVESATARRQVRLNPVSFPRKKAHVDLVPRGVVGVIAPWNYPVAGLTGPRCPRFSPATRWW
jgi:acyl-CoA reductase-like NAD-dependent aldehyde dehydrogenase